MKIRILKSEGGEMERDITKSVAMFLFCALVIVILLMAWVLFSPQPRLERVKIAVHNGETFKKLQAKHGKVNTGVVVYEEDGQAYYYKGEEKIKFQ